jgi:hypothetical protein
MNVDDTLTATNLVVTGTSNLGSASARYNIQPFAPRIGLIGGYLIYASDPNPSFIPFITNTTQGIYDYINGNGSFEMIDQFTLQINRTGFYSVSIEMITLSNSGANIVYQLLSSQFPFTPGAVPPILSPIGTLTSVTAITLPYSFAGTPNCTCNCVLNAGDTVKLAYLTTADGEIALTSNFSINRIG